MMERHVLAYPINCLEEMRWIKTIVSRGSVWCEIWTCKLPNMKKEC